MDWTANISAAVSSMRCALGVDNYYCSDRASVAAVRGARLLLPYVLHPIQGRPDHWIWLNRSYKPLGTSGAWAKYEDYEYLHVRRDDIRIARLKPECFKWGAGDGLALYNDFTDPCHSALHARDYARLLSRVDLTPNV